MTNEMLDRFPQQPISKEKIWILSKQRRFPGGSLCIMADVQNGKISDIAFEGDFMALEDVSPAATALTGCFFERDSVARALSTLDLTNIFGAITAENILDLMFS